MLGLYVKQLISEKINYVIFMYYLNNQVNYLKLALVLKNQTETLHFGNQVKLVNPIGLHHGEM